MGQNAFERTSPAPPPPLNFTNFVTTNCSSICYFQQIFYQVALCKEVKANEIKEEVAKADEVKEDVANE